VFSLALAVALTIPAIASAQGVMYVTGGNVGIGTDTPATKLHVKDGNLTVEQSAAATNAVLDFKTATSNWEIKQNGNTGRLTFFSPGGGATTASFKFDRSAVENLFRVGILAGDTVDINGKLVINGNDVTPDYVFSSDYDLESIEEHAEFMWSNQHLPAVPSAADNANGVNIVQSQFGVLEELEKAHIYIAQLNETLKRLEAEIAELKQQQ
jgi:hypothetical protein